MKKAAALALLLSVAPQAAPDTLITCLTWKPSARWSLPRALREISGLAFTDDGRLLAHDDERAVVYQVDYKAGTIAKTFQLGNAPPGDYEGITVAAGRVYMITSNGKLYEFAEGKDGQSVPFTMTDTGAGSVCEIEGITWDPASRALLLLCKTFFRKELKGTITLLRWSPDQKKWMSPDRVTVPLTKRIRQMLGGDFRGSDVTRDPRSGHFVAVAGINRAAAEFTAAGDLVALGPLGKHHSQAEGIAIARDGATLVSDEGTGGPAHLAVYACTK